MSTEDTLELVKRVARKRMLSSNKFDRYMRAMDEVVPDETREERHKRLADLHWALFDTPPPFNREAERPGQQAELPLEGDDASIHRY